MYMYRAAVHIRLFRNCDLECMFSRDPRILRHLTHASILPLYLTSLALSVLVASCVSGYSLEPDQASALTL